MPPTAKSPIPIWLTRDHSVPIHDQLVTQVLLGILSDDLKPGQRLPSVRALARVLHVNSNTVSGAYRELVRDGWLEARHGSGMYVRSAPVPARSRLEDLLMAFVGMARREGWTTTDIRHSVERELARTSSERLLLFEPEPELRDVLLREIEESCGVRLGVYADSTSAQGALIVAMQGRAQLLERELPSHAPRLLLPVTSIPAALLGSWPARAGYTNRHRVGIARDPAARPNRTAGRRNRIERLGGVRRPPTRLARPGHDV